ncbi:chemotaxis protein CheB [Prosthecobacter sp.]|uniref:chemotaxis protein CheB n=1 Tax=Prosthecobacter sp. TaxID=1965333 RepID=UPI00248852A1|nr:chemotaxis protein CheB [Prosthecobacter sp.]MDI1312281.1 chemotaxis protein CheB [Prosthecobacter sp.]
MPAENPTQKEMPNPAVRTPAFPIVAVGASAGGLEALRQLLQALPADTGMGFVIVQHLSPDHGSNLAEILGRATQMPVCQVSDEPEVEANHVYVIPPGRDMLIAKGRLQLLQQGNRAPHHGIDQFFHSLAEDDGRLIIGVVLSGSANDGTLGIEEIKAMGGIVFAQDDSAQHASMPRSAVATGCVDFVLPPAEIAHEIARIARLPQLAVEAPTQGPEHARIAQIVRRAMGVDFTHYKAQTLHRRITRRMMLQKIDTLREYEAYLRSTPGETEALYQDVLINVTSFFRNPDAFEALAATVFPQLLATHQRHEPLRIWTLGCSTGEEAYSLAMVFTECAEAAGSPVQLQLFATDLNGVCIEKARKGLYPASIERDVSPERLRRFFTREEGGWRICKSIREHCIFSRHNALADPPFSRVDLISCRNLLIYFEPQLQRQLFPVLHYAMKPGGCLWLGSSETVGTHRKLFDVEDVKHKIFKRRPGSTALRRHQPVEHVEEHRLSPLPVQRARDVPHAELYRDAERLLLARYSPPGVVVSAGMEILQFRGETGAYLAPAAGTPSLHLLKMLREGLLIGVRAAITRAGVEGRAVREEGLRVKNESGVRQIAVEVIPLKNSLTREGGFVVLFDEGEHAAASAPPTRPLPTTGSAEEEMLRLTQELAATREYLESVIEQQAAVNEELQSANEETQSANEELQSVNEELETSKEEIQSSNEELATVNDELNHRNLELQEARDYAEDIVACVRVPLLVLTKELRIRTASRAFYECFKATPSTTLGRLIYDINDHQWDIPELRRLLEKVLPLESVIDHFEVRHTFEVLGSRVMQMRACRLPNTRNEPLIVVSVEDITERVEAEDAANRLAAIVSSSDDAIMSKDLNGIITTWNAGAERLFGYAAAEVIGQPVTLFIPAERQAEEAHILGHIRSGEPVEHFETLRLRKDGRLIDVSLTISPIRDSTGRVVGASKIARDITGRRLLENALVARAEELARADRTKDEFLAMLAHELRNPLAPMRNAAEIMHAENASTAERQHAQCIIVRQIENMSRMIEDLLDISRITHGKIELRKKPVALEDILTAATSVVRSSCSSHQQELTVAMPQNPIYLNADATRLEQVFCNLLSNACKYSGDGCHIVLRAERSLGVVPPEVIVSVRDDGIGIAPELLPHVFDLFVQATRALDRAHGGLGIGLTLVQRIVKLHDGSVEVRSAGLGQGSEFIVRLPILREPPLRPELPADTARETPRRILIVDDNTDSARSLAILQRRRGHETCTAFTGPEALSAAAEFKPEVVLLDIGLPGMNGFEVARQLRMMSALKGVFLIAMSGYGSAEDRVAASKAGFDEYFVKPIDLSVLSQSLKVRSSSV